MQTKINWFEIPADDLSRASTFYETIFDTKLRTETSEFAPMVIFTDSNGNSLGALTKADFCEPGHGGTLVYLDAGPSIQTVIDRIAGAGGKVIMDKFALPKQLGYIAHFTDSEGNRIALHAMQ